MAGAGHYPHTVLHRATFDNSANTKILFGYHSSLSNVKITCFLELSKNIICTVPDFINVTLNGDDIGIIEMNDHRGKSSVFNYGKSNYDMFNGNQLEIHLQGISKERNQVIISGNILIQFDFEYDNHKK